MRISDWSSDVCSSDLLGLCSFGLLHVQGAEIDGFEQQRREAAITHSVGQYAAGKGEEQARRFGKEERLNLISGHVAHSKQNGIGKLHLASYAVGRLRLHIDLQQHFEYVIATLRGTDVEMNVDLGDRKSTRLKSSH